MRTISGTLRPRARAISPDTSSRDERLASLSGAPELEHVRPEIFTLDDGRERAPFAQRRYISCRGYGSEQIASFVVACLRKSKLRGLRHCGRRLDSISNTLFARGPFVRIGASPGLLRASEESTESDFAAALSSTTTESRAMNRFMVKN